MAAPVWSEESGSEVIRLLADPSQQPTDTNSLLYLLVEYCKRLAHDSVLDRLICSRLAMMEDKQIMKVFKALGEIQWRWQHQTLPLQSHKAPKLKLPTVYSSAMPPYKLRNTFLKIKCEKHATVYIHGLNSFDPTSWCSTDRWKLVDSVSYKKTSYLIVFEMVMLREASRLCTLLLFESTFEGTSYSAFTACLIDVSTPMFHQNARDAALASPSTVAASVASPAPLPTRSAAYRTFPGAPSGISDPRCFTRTITLARHWYPLREIPKHSWTNSIQPCYIAKFFGPVQGYIPGPWPQEFYAEMEFLDSHFHPNLLPRIGCSPVNTTPIIYFEADGLLYDWVITHEWSMVINTKTWREIFHALFSVAEGLQYLHTLGIVHGRLWTGSVLRKTNGFVQIFDYTEFNRVPQSYAQIANPDSTTLALVDLFQAPETIGESKFGSTSADVYSFGVFLWSLFHTGRPQYTVTDFLEKRIKLPVNDELQFQTRGVESLFRKCTHRKASKRPSMSEVIVELDTIFKSQLDSLPDLPLFDPVDPDGIESCNRRWFFGNRKERR